MNKWLHGHCHKITLFKRVKRLTLITHRTESSYRLVFHGCFMWTSVNKYRFLFGKLTLWGGVNVIAFELCYQKELNIDFQSWYVIYIECQLKLTLCIMVIPWHDWYYMYSTKQTIHHTSVCVTQMIKKE